MGHRTVKRVPLDFDAPLHETWSGYVRPAELALAVYPACEGRGTSAQYLWQQATFAASSN
jgi:hypothetical protein